MLYKINSPEPNKLPPRHKLNFDGKIFSLYKIRLINFILSTLTLGIYSFWGKVRARKYAASSFSLLGDRFEYTGTGAELFKGFLFIMLVGTVFVALVTSILGKIFGTETEIAQGIIFILSIFFIVPIINAASYKATAYRYSRTNWRGIRGGLDGSMWKYAWICFTRSFINFITLGILIPKSDMKIAEYMISNTYVGNVRCKFDRKMGSLFKVNLITLLLFIPTLGLSRFWYAAALARCQFASMGISSLRIFVNYTGAKLFGLFLSNFLIMIFTLGLGRSIVIIRIFRFISKNMIIAGEINVNEFKQVQSDLNAGASGEGVDMALDLGGGLY